jgi:chromosome segregation ATPase
MVQVQNQGLETQLQTATKEVEQLMSMDKLGEEVGEQVKQMAKEQKTAQGSIGEDLAKLNARKGVLKALFGPDHAAVQNLQKEISRNQMRINILEKIQAQVKNQADQTQLKVATQALVEQNTALQQKVQAEEQTKSLFGWMIRMFQK